MLFLTQTGLSVPALTGAIMCMGVATANSILVVSFAREQLAEGKSPVDAALEAGATRFRPVLMPTALAMIIGMAQPMAIEVGEKLPAGTRRHRRPYVCDFRDVLLFVADRVFNRAPNQSGTKPKPNAAAPLVRLPSHA